MFLNRTRTVEQTVIETFFNFYEVFFYDDFHVMYNNYLVEKLPDVPAFHREISYLLSKIYQILDRLVEDYRLLHEVNNKIGGLYIQPIVQALSDGPTEHQDCLRRYGCLDETTAADQGAQQNVSAQPSPVEPEPSNDQTAQDVSSPGGQSAQPHRPQRPVVDRAFRSAYSHEYPPVFDSSDEEEEDVPFPAFFGDYVNDSEARRQREQSRAIQLQEQVDGLQRIMRRTRLSQDPAEIAQVQVQGQGHHAQNARGLRPSDARSQTETETHHGHA
ncbi:hypothetical protein BJX61DRAFT_522709 [Aspergillus egyptiacus]|nr:hypothetical protein BJX61DRAFT_522709 [Aspergillus egyptiacus]